MLPTHFHDSDGNLTKKISGFCSDFRSINNSFNDLAKPCYDLFVKGLSHFHEFRAPLMPYSTHGSLVWVSKFWTCSKILSDRQNLIVQLLINCQSVRAPLLLYLGHTCFCSVLLVLCSTVFNITLAFRFGIFVSSFCISDQI